MASHNHAHVDCGSNCSITMVGTGNTPLTHPTVSVHETHNSSAAADVIQQQQNTASSFGGGSANSKSKSLGKLMNDTMDVLKECITKVITKTGSNNKRKLVDYTVLYCFGKYGELVMQHGLTRKQLRARITGRINTMKNRQRAPALGRFRQYINHGPHCHCRRV